MSRKKRGSVVLWHNGYRCRKIALVSLTNANKSCCQNLQHQELVSFKHGDWVSFFDYICNMTSFNSIRMQKNLILFHKGKVCMSEWVIFFSCVCVCVCVCVCEDEREREWEREIGYQESVVCTHVNMFMSGSKFAPPLSLSGLARNRSRVWTEQQKQQN